MIPLWEV